jgi:hypothetical protein
MTTRTYMADQLGTPEEVSFGGRTYQLVPADHVDVVRRFERHLIRQAQRIADEMRPDASDPEEADDRDLYRRWKSLADDTQARITTGYFAFGNAGYVDGSATQGGFLELVYLCLRVHSPEVTRPLVRDWFEDDDASAALVAAYNRVNSRPKAKAGATPTPPPPPPSAATTPPPGPTSATFD